MQWKILTGDVFNRIHDIPDKTVQMVVTSPPYFGLRDYFTGEWEGGDPNCDHAKTVARHDGGRSQVDGFHGSTSDDSDKGKIYYSKVCKKCGAVRKDNQIGVEGSVQEYVDDLVAVFREVRRVLRDDGVVFLNLGDTYAANNLDGLKPKDLIGIPWRVAFALQADGWWLRQDIIWDKRNRTMPNSVTDRCTTAHEYIFLLTKQEKYFYDAYAIREKGSIPRGTMAAKGSVERRGVAGVNARPSEYYEYDGMKNHRSVWSLKINKSLTKHHATFPISLPEICIRAGTSEKGRCPKCGAPWIREKTDIGKNVYWKAGCDCGEDPVPCVVLDIFSGSGTTGVACKMLNRDYIGIELNPSYAEESKAVIRSVKPPSKPVSDFF